MDVAVDRLVVLETGTAVVDARVTDRASVGGPGGLASVATPVADAVRPRRAG